MGSYERSTTKGEGVHSEAFAHFLERLSPDAEEAGLIYIRLHKKLCGLFHLKGIADPIAATDEAIDRAVLKIASGAVVSDIEKYCKGIARNVALESLRILRREASAFQIFIDELGRNSSEGVGRLYEVLKPCFEQLDEEDQRLLMAYCHREPGGSRAAHRSQVAETMRISAVALRLRVSRLRRSLTDCVQGRSADSKEPGEQM
jgi:hypothetical protein